MKSLLPGFLISLLFFLALVLTLSDYGVHEDNLIHFMRGQYFLHKITTGKTQFDPPAGSGVSPVFYVPGQRISLYKPNPPEESGPLRPFGKQIKELRRNTSPRTSFYVHNAWAENVFEVSDQGHPAVSDILMALSNRIFYEKLGIIGDIEGYDLYIVVVSTIAIFFVYFFTQRVFGTTAALFASITLGLFPFYFAEAHFNTKDTVQMSFFTVSLVSLYFFVVNKTKPLSHNSSFIIRNSHLLWFTSFIISAFLALGTKWNIGFLPFIFLPWLWLVHKKKEIKEALATRWLIVYAILAVFIPFMFLIIVWPYLWNHPLEKLIETLNFYKHSGLLDPRVDTLPPFNLPLGFNLTALLRVITMTPPLSLFLFTLGFAAIVFRKVKYGYSEEWLILFWFAAPLLRVSRELADTAGSIRHFIEYLPAFAIIAGIGAAYVISKIKDQRSKIKLGPLFLILYSLFLILTIIRTHPNENIYFNFLAGGLSGAEKSGLYSWKATYDNVYRQGAVWLNQHAPKDAKLAYLDGTMLAISPLWLRDDIYFGSYFSGYEQKGEYIISLIYPKPPAVFAYNYLDRFLDPVYELKVDGTAVLKIWQNSESYTRKEFQQQQALVGSFEITKVKVENGRAWEIDLGKVRKVARLILVFPKECTGRRGGVWSLISASPKTLRSQRRDEGAKAETNVSNTSQKINSGFSEADVNLQEKTPGFSPGKFIESGKEKFIVPGESVKDGKVEVDFPAEPATKIRFWDVEGNSCLYEAKIEGIYSIK